MVHGLNALEDNKRLTLPSYSCVGSTVGQNQLHNSVQLNGPAIPLSPQLDDRLTVENQTVDIFYPFFDPESVDLFANDSIPNLSPFDTWPFDLQSFDIEADANATSVS